MNEYGLFGKIEKIRLMQNNHNDRLGYYMVGWKKFYHKTLALIESKRSGYKLDWIFNDKVYSNIDWSIPIPINLDQLYRLRAQQLRNNYDYLALYFSGGADSSNMLRAFVNNNIFLDEIVMQSPEPAKYSFNNLDKSDANVYSEIPYSAIPIINELKNLIHPSTKIRYQDTSKGLISLLNQDDWFEKHPFGVSLALNPLTRQHTSFTEKHILDLCDSGKRIAQIVGTDKPLLFYDGANYYSYFLDTTALHSPPMDLTNREIYEKSYHTELFYWTPDLPEISIKQAQEVKKYCEINQTIRDVVCNSKLHIEKLREVLHPIIYPSLPEVPFQVGKGGMGAVRKKDQWFWDNATARHKQNFQSVIGYLKDNISEDAFINKSVDQGLVGHRSKFYKL